MPMRAKTWPSWKLVGECGERNWARRLGRLRLGVEPLEEQLTRYRRTTWALAVVPGIIALMFLTLFTVFGRPDIGFAVILILFVPMILFAWVGYARLKRRAAAYLADRARFEEEKKRLLDTSVQTTTS